jgi:hypothetical protein
MARAYAQSCQITRVGEHFPVAAVRFLVVRYQAMRFMRSVLTAHLTRETVPDKRLRSEYLRPQFALVP